MTRPDRVVRDNSQIVRRETGMVSGRLKCKSLCWQVNWYSICFSSIRWRRVAMQIELAGAGWEPEWSQRSDAEILAGVSWKRGTSAELVQAARKGNIEAFVGELARGWKQPDEMIDPTCRALWTLPAINASPREQAMAAILSPDLPRTKGKPGPARPKSKSTEESVDSWWLQFQPVGLTPWEFLALLELLPNRISRLPVSTAFGIWRLLLQIACDQNQLLALDDKKPEKAEELERYGFQADPYLDLALFRNCELPWLSGVVFSSVKGSEKLRRHGADLLEHELVERTDDHGTPHAALLPRWSMWLAIYTRFVKTAMRHGLTPWDDDAAELFRTAVEKTAPLIQPDGRLTFSRVSLENSRPFIEEVLRTTGWPDAEAAIQSLLTFPKRTAKQNGSGRNITSAARRTPLEICLAPVNQSDESAWAVMRTHWGAHADRVVIEHDQPAQNIELMIQGQRILEGEWRSTLTINKKVIPVRGDWSCVCWQSDPDGDYLELQLTLPGVARIERQVLISRTRQFCILAESFAEMPDGEFTYHSRWPTCAGIAGTSNAKTREIRFEAGGVPIRCFPVALPDRHVFSTPGKFGTDLSCTTTVRGTGWYNPILLDWSPARRTAPAEWKALTVAEDRTAVKPGVASGYRLKLGSHQWLMYRSLIRTDEPRSVLGHQTRYETVIGSVEANGDITPLMLVE
ncbi:MAG: hypothetical protein JWM11_3600 [Planctomycetaceae bacterium]|nr:hypothetical protein [Planctomycetaceae bacterium]